jgi:ferric-dicitrate binding protein FerR (iron transport regulator)
MAMRDSQADEARTGGAEPQEERLAALIRAAGRRPAAPAEREERVRAAVHARWREMVMKRSAPRRDRRWPMLGAVAAVAAAVLLVFVFRAPSGPAAGSSVAALEFASGPVQMRLADGVSHDVAVGERFPAGALLETPAGSRAALRLAGGPSLRMDGETRLRLESAQVVTLERGAVYVDSASGAPAAPGVEVRTRLGVVRDVGTQFEVRLSEGAVRVRVREGKIVLARERETSEAKAGMELDAGTSGPVRQSLISAYDPAWDWVVECAPAFDLEGRTLSEFLAWAGRERCWQVRYEDSRVERESAAIRLHGSVKGLKPEQALQAVLPACGLTSRLETGTLWIGVTGGDRKSVV